MRSAAAAVSLYVFAFAANVVSQSQDTYPHVDEEGKYLAYKVSRLSCSQVSLVQLF